MFPAPDRVEFRPVLSPDHHDIPMSHCLHCPMPEGTACRGESARRLCDLIDPGHPDFIPGYDRAIVDSSSPGAAKYPPLATQAGNAVKALGRVAVAVMRREQIVVDQAEFDRRRSICEACPNIDREQDRCRVCACFLAVKPWTKSEKCPEGRWEAQAAPLDGANAQAGGSGG